LPLGIAGTFAVIRVAEAIVNDELYVLSFTEVGPVKLIPVTVTVVPASPGSG